MAKKLVLAFVLLLIVGASIFAWQVNRASPPYYVTEEPLVNELPPIYDTFEAPPLFEHTTETRAENLKKLAMVWGFTKYTHLAFISGEKCWDAELKQLIPIIYDAHPDDVNNILYEWFAELGEDGYELEYAHDFVWANYNAVQIATLEGYEANARHMYAIGMYTESHLEGWLYRLSPHFEFYAAIDAAGYEPNWPEFVTMWNEAFPGSPRAIAAEVHNLRASLDFAWIDSGFLGEPLAARLLRFNGITAVDRSRAPVYFDGIANSVFSNQDRDRIIVNPDKNTRLLGLFRMWNAMLYFYPNLDIIDYCWHESLLEYIPIMLGGSDRDSYFSTLISLARRLDDAHIHIGSRLTHRPFTGPVDHPGAASTQSHVLLENNIGLINPARVWGDIPHIMEAFRDTDGLIIDLRQRPRSPITHELAEYLVEESTRFAVMSHPHQSFPGTFVYMQPYYSGGITSPYAFFYDRPVVILMNRVTMSQPEFAVMSLRNGKNVTVIGSNSIGANGNAAFLPLPGGDEMMFTGLGVFTPEGGQTHRIGLSPDIYIVPSIESIREGRDELMETAVRFILTGDPS